MIIKDSHGSILSSSAQFAGSFNQRLLGLLDPKNSRALIFHTRFGLHTFFMKTPIDIILLNESNRVVKIKENLQPYRLFFYHPRYSIVIELPPGTIKKFKLGINDKILVE